MHAESSLWETLMSSLLVGKEKLLEVVCVGKQSAGDALRGRESSSCEGSGLSDPRSMGPRILNEFFVHVIDGDVSLKIKNPGRCGFI